MLGLAVMGLLLLFLLLGRSTVGATSERAAPIPDIWAQNDTFTVSGTVKCGATGPISDVEVYVWNQDQGTGFVGDTTDSSGYYSVTLDLPSAPDTYSLEFTPTPETGLNARAFTAIELMTDTVVNVDFCVCSGVWVSETVDSTGDVGAWTSLALALTYPYTPHISYHDGTNDSLKHAWLSGTTWLSETVDSGRGSTSLALVPTYPHYPFISYDAPYDTIKFACWDGAAWITIEGFGTFDWGSSLALEPTYPYTPHVSFFRSRGHTRDTLYHAYLSGTVWCNGTLVLEQVEPWHSHAGINSSLALEPTYPYTFHISYYIDSTHENDDLKYAWKSGTTWLSETVDSAGDVGWYTSLTLDSNNDPHISYLDYTNEALKYAWKSGTTWLSETVDSIGEPSYGTGTSLELDQADIPYISYYDASNGDLKFSHFNGTVWVTQTVDSGGDVGQYSSLALDQAGCPHISYYYDGTNGDLRYAYIPPIEIYLPVITKNYSKVR